MESLADIENSNLLESLGGSVNEFHESESSINTSNSHSPGSTSSIEERALVLLGSGIQQESVAAALGVTPSRISQLMADKDFADAVTELRFQALQSHNERDNKYDKLEDRLLDSLGNKLPLMMKPAEILKAIQIINGAKRRGQSSPEQVTNQQNIVNILLPEKVAVQFTTNVNNQVIKAGEKELMTMPSSQLLNKVEETQALPPPVVPAPQEEVSCVESTDIEKEEPL